MLPRFRGISEVVARQDADAASSQHATPLVALARRQQRRSESEETLDYFERATVLLRNESRRSIATSLVSSSSLFLL
jgi:hypothetical protein